MIMNNEPGWISKKKRSLGILNCFSIPLEILRKLMKYLSQNNGFEPSTFRMCYHCVKPLHAPRWRIIFEKLIVTQLVKQ
jgi:hypothetical protein